MLEEHEELEELDILEFNYANPRERRDEGVPIGAIKKWFPEETAHGKLPRALLNGIWDRYPKPEGSVLKTSALDLDLVDEVPSFAVAKDSEIRHVMRDFACAFRPIVHLALVILEDNELPEAKRKLIVASLRETILLYNHAAANAETERRRAIGKAGHWPDSLISKCLTTVSNDKARLFGEQFVSEYKQWRQDKRAEETISTQKEAMDNLAKSVSALKVRTGQNFRPQATRGRQSFRGRPRNPKAPTPRNEQ